MSDNYTPSRGWRDVFKDGRTWARETGRVRPVTYFVAYNFITMAWIVAENVPAQEEKNTVFFPHEWPTAQDAMDWVERRIKAMGLDPEGEKDGSENV